MATIVLGKPTFRPIAEMWAWIAVDPADNTEGVMGFYVPGHGWMAAVGADRERMESLRPRIMEMLRSGRPESAKLVRFSERREIETVRPSLLVGLP